MPATKKATLDGLQCPRCNTDEDTMYLDMTTFEECRCSSCEETFPIRLAILKAEQSLAAWRKVERLAEFGRQIAAE